MQSNKPVTLQTVCHLCYKMAACKMKLSGQKACYAIDWRHLHLHSSFWALIIILLGSDELNIIASHLITLHSIACCSSRSGSLCLCLCWPLPQLEARMLVSKGSLMKCFQAKNKARNVEMSNNNNRSLCIIQLQLRVQLHFALFALDLKFCIRSRQVRKWTGWKLQCNLLLQNQVANAIGAFTNDVESNVISDLRSMSLEVANYTLGTICSHLRNGCKWPLQSLDLNFGVGVVKWFSWRGNKQIIHISSYLNYERVFLRIGFYSIFKC